MFISPTTLIHRVCAFTEDCLANLRILNQVVVLPPAIKESASAKYILLHVLACVGNTIPPYHCILIVKMESF